MPVLIRVLISAILFVFSIQSMLYSQNVENDSNEYYSDFSNSLIVKPYLAFNAGDFYIYYNDAGGKNKMIKYNTLEKETNGISFSWHDYGLSVGISRVTAPEYKDQDCDEDLSFDFRINYLGRKICYDLYYMKQDGLFLRNGYRNPDGTLPYYDSMSYMILSANLYYIFSSDTFSLRGAYNAVDMQKKSAGSFLLMMSSGLIRLKDETSILREEIYSVEERLKGMKEIRSGYISLSPGYSYTFVFWGNLYFNFLIFAGLGADLTDYYVFTGKIREEEVYLRANTKFALGYSNENFFCGASLNLDIHKLSNGSDLSTQMGFYDSKFYAGYRFLNL